jgi:phage terminase small subunit
VATRDPLEFLLDVMQGVVTPTREQLRAAVAATQYKHPKKGDAGKKEGASEMAKAVGAGKFAAAQPPKLIASNGRKV